MKKQSEIELRDIEKPWRYKDWLIWPRTVLENMELSDCNDTIDGVCFTGKSIRECIEQCTGDCAAGIHVQFEDGRTVCAPLNTALHPLLNPIFRLRKQSLYKLDPNLVEMSVFVNIKVWPFPPNLANTVFHQDTIAIVEASTGDRVITSDALVEGGGSMFVGEGSSSIRIDVALGRANPVQRDMPLIYGERIIFAIPGTSFIARDGSIAGTGFQWEASIQVFWGIDMTFSLIPLNEGRTLGDVVNYSDSFAIEYSGLGIIIVDPITKQLRLDSNIDLRSLSLEGRSKKEINAIIDSLSNVRSGGPFLHARFQFISKLNGYYCDDGQCKMVPIRDVNPIIYPNQAIGKQDTSDHVAGTYQGHTVFNNMACWGICNYVQKGHKEEGTLTLAGNEHFPEFKVSPSYVGSTILGVPVKSKKGVTLISLIVILVLTVIIVLLVVRHYRRST